MLFVERPDRRQPYPAADAGTGKPFIMAKSHDCGKGDRQGDLSEARPISEPADLPQRVVCLSENVLQTRRVEWPGLEQSEGPVVKSRIDDQITQLPSGGHLKTDPIAASSAVPDLSG
ncbi:MAG: hypothetical protein HY290_04030 [Planctomycetia bacterium]|nr:hypothetical protein [Planctomycetia bacterium]